jgi:hypothetical protein
MFASRSLKSSRKGYSLTFLHELIIISYLIQKHVFEPPHRRIEGNEERQREIEHAFENIYMAQSSKHMRLL